VAAFEEAIDLMRSTSPSAAKLTARTYRADFAAPEYGPGDVQRVRGVLRMSQSLFARFLGVDVNTIRSWEQGTRSPSAIARRFMAEIETDSDYWKRRVGQALLTASEIGQTEA
jgi:putative transcriptional regulator